MCFWAPSKKTLLSIVALAILFEILAGFGIKEFPPTEFLFYFLLGFGVNHALRFFNHRKFPGSTAVAIVVGFFAGNGVYYVLFNSDAEWIANPIIGIVAAFMIYLIELPRADEDAVQSYERYGTARLITLRFWTWMGILSYGVYLWHLPVIYLAGPTLVESSYLFVQNLTGVEAGWARMLVVHAIQIPIILGITVLVSLITFFTVELRFRPHLYHWDSSKYVFKHLKFITPRNAKDPVRQPDSSPVHEFERDARREGVTR